MSARSSMTQRMVVERSTSVGLDDYDRVETWTTLYEDVPCRYWVRSRRELAPTQTVNVAAVIEDARIICPVVDISEGDRIRRVTDRQGRVQVGGPLDIQGIEQRFAGDPHLELLVREVA